MNNQPYLKSFVQRNRKITKKQHELLDHNQCLIKSFEEIKKDLNNYVNVNLEIGFGKGDFLLKNARLFPQELFLGSEPFLSGVLDVLEHSSEEQIQNIRVFKDDVRIFLSSMKEPVLNKIFVLFPDPWPKVRHNKRRILNEFLLNQIFDSLTINGQLHIVTDIDDYAEWVRKLFQNDARFKILDNKNILSLEDLNTFYCKKALEKKHTIHIFGFYK